VCGLVLDKATLKFGADEKQIDEIEMEQAT